jgi:hypothetical protein
MTARHSQGEKKMNTGRLWLAATLTVVLLPDAVMAHGFAGKRFFPATMAVDDPFVADEAGMVISHQKAPNDDGTPTGTTAASVEYAKTLTPHFGVSVGATYLHQKPEGAATQNGFDNLEIGAKYLLHKSDAHETLVSIGANAELGGTGSSHVGANPHSTLSPALYFGKGFGDLPDAMQCLRPLAITGVVSPGFSTRSFNAQSVDTGFTVQYNLNYLQSYVKDIGLNVPFNRLIPVIEVPLSTCTTGDCSGQTTGTVNPGVLYVGNSYQLGLEAAIPINHASGRGTGVLAQVHFFLDDLFPNSLGKPVFK